MVYTKTSNPKLIGNERKVSEEDKLIPSIQFSVNGAKVVVLALTIYKPQVRLILDAVYLLAAKLIDKDYFCNLLLRTIQNENNEYELRNIKLEMVDLYEELDLPLFPELDLEYETVGQMAYHLFRNGTVTISNKNISENIFFIRMISLITKNYLEEKFGKSFTTLYNYLSYNKDTLGYRDGYLYPEDVIFGREYATLEGINRMSGGAHSSYITLREAYEKDSFFSENRDMFFKTRCNCGGDLVLRKDDYGQFTLMSCINPHCFEKMAFSLSEFISELGTDGLGATTLRSMTSGLALSKLSVTGDSSITYRELIKEENHIYLGEANKLKWEEFLEKSAAFGGTIKELITKASLPYVGSMAAKAITGDMITNDNINPEIIRKSCFDSGIKDLKNVLNIWMYWDDLTFLATELCKQVNLLQTKDFKICITGGVKLNTNEGIVGYSKKSFLNALNQALIGQGEKVIRFVLSTSMTKDCRVLIADGARDTGKCNTAEDYGIPILTSREFLDNIGGL